MASLLFATTTAFAAMPKAGDVMPPFSLTQTTTTKHKP